MHFSDEDLRLENASDYESVLRKILLPITHYFDDSKSTIDLPCYYATSYSDKTLALESLSRALWGFAFYQRNSGDIDRIFIMIANGVNPASEEYWGNISDFSQVIVEMFPILLFCDRHKAQFNDYSNDIKINIEKWFLQINKVGISNNNWQFFVVLINNELKRLGLGYSQKMIDESLNNIELMYLGNGWYSDGHTSQRDYYISFAFHYYSLLYCVLDGNQNYIDKYKTRALEFSKTFLYWFDNNGSALPFGRSLTYKFAQSAFWSMMIVADVDASNNGVYKGMLNRNLRWWLKQKIFDANDLLTIGYAYPNQTFSEYYNGTGSSYWALKTFAILLCKDDSTIFNIMEDPFPLRNDKSEIPEAKMIVQRYDGHVYAFVNGQKAINAYGHTETKYEKFVYTTLFGFCISKSSLSKELLSCDSNVFISLNGKDYFARHDCEGYDTIDGVLKSTWTPDRNVIIESYIIPGAPGHFRVHCIKTGRDLEFFDSGYAIKSENCQNNMEKDGIALYANEDQLSVAVSLYGGAEPIIITPVPNTNALYPRCMIPALKWVLKSGSYLIIDYFYGSANEGISIDGIIQNKPKVIVKKDEVILGLKHIKIDGTVKYKEPNRLIDIVKRCKRELNRIQKSV